jgi:hypothetical protein
MPGGNVKKAKNFNRDFGFKSKIKTGTFPITGEEYYGQGILFR